MGGGVCIPSFGCRTECVGVVNTEKEKGWFMSTPSLWMMLCVRESDLASCNTALTCLFDCSVQNGTYIFRRIRKTPSFVATVARFRAKIRKVARDSTVHFQASSSSRNHLTAFTSHILLYSIERNRRGPVGFEVGSGELAAIRLATFFLSLGEIDFTT